MSVFLTVIIIIFILGVLIITHELGHFWMARARGVRVLEFAIGMGPVIYKRHKTLPDGSQGTKFTLRLLPIGGFCAMEGEDADSSDPRAFGNASLTSRFLILTAGSLMNLLLGIVLCFIFVIPINYSAVPVVETIEPESALAPYVQAGDEIVAINGRRILRYDNVLMFLSLGQGRPYDLEVLRDGQKHKYDDITIDRRDFNDGSGLRYGFSCGYRENSISDKLSYAVIYAADNVRMIWISLGELFSGRAGLSDLMGPVGMGGVVNTVLSAPEITLLDRVWNILYWAIVFALNLAVMNLLPFPALDGGRLVFLLIEGVLRKPMPAKVEGIIHGAGMICLFALMIFVLFNDIMRQVS